MASFGLFLAMVGAMLVVAAALMWNRVLRDRGEDVRATVIDSEVVETGAIGADYAAFVEYEYRWEGQTYSHANSIHTEAMAEDDSDPPALPQGYREGATVTVSVSPDEPSFGMLPDPGEQKLYRFLVPALVVGGTVLLLGGGVIGL